MTPSQHINNIAKRLGPALRKKYAKGVKAHGGGLWKKNVGPEIEGELLDLIVYVYTREEQVKELVAAAQQYMFDTYGEHHENTAELRAALAPFLRANKPHDD